MLFLSSYFVLFRCGCFKGKSISFPISWNFFVGKYAFFHTFSWSQQLTSAVAHSTSWCLAKVLGREAGLLSNVSVWFLMQIQRIFVNTLLFFFSFQIIQSDVFGHLHHVLFFGLQLRCSFWDFSAISLSHLHKGQSFFLAPSVTSFFKTSHALQLFPVPHAEGWSDRTSIDPSFFGWFHRLCLVVNAQTIFFPLVQYHAQMILCAACKQSTFTFTSYIMTVASKTCRSICRLNELI